MTSPITLLLQLAIPVMAVVFLGGFVWLWSKRRLPPRFWALFALGMALGAVWELGFGLMSSGPGQPLFHWIEPGGAPLDPQPPDTGLTAGFLLAIAAVCIWDAAIFIAGLFLVERLRPAPALARWRWSELAVLLAWGQLQSFAVEMVAIAGGLWGYVAGPYNPGLFPFMEGTITLWPQLVWLVAYPVFYAFAVRWWWRA